MGRPAKAASNKASSHEDSPGGDKTLQEINSKLQTIEDCNAKVSEVLSPVSTLRADIAERDAKILKLEERVNDLEQYTRMDDIFSGLKSNHKSYARSVMSNPDDDHSFAPAEELNTLEDNVVDFFNNSLQLDLNEADISVCHTLPGKKSIPDILVRVSRRKTKIKILKESRKLKGLNIYLNEHLSFANASIAREARAMRKQHKIASTWVRNCKIFVKTLGPPDRAKVLSIRTREDLRKIENA